MPPASKGVPQDILRKEANKRCADCGGPDPRYGAVNLGVFVCETCADLHRKLGSHVSQIKSVRQDEWKPEWIEIARGVGNDHAKEYYEANVPAGQRYAPNPTVSKEQADRLLEKWIRNKYEAKKFAPAGVDEPAKRVKRGESLDAGAATTAEVPSGPSEKEEKKKEKKKEKKRKEEESERSASAPPSVAVLEEPESRSNGRAASVDDKPHKKKHHKDHKHKHRSHEDAAAAAPTAYMDDGAVPWGGSLDGSGGAWGAFAGAESWDASAAGGFEPSGQFMAQGMPAAGGGFDPSGQFMAQGMPAAGGGFDPSGQFMAQGMPAAGGGFGAPDPGMLQPPGGFGVADAGPSYAGYAEVDPGPSYAGYAEVDPGGFGVAAAGPSYAGYSEVDPGGFGVAGTGPSYAGYSEVDPGGFGVAGGPGPSYTGYAEVDPGMLHAAHGFAARDQGVPEAAGDYSMLGQGLSEQAGGFGPADHGVPQYVAAGYFDAMDQAAFQGSAALGSSDASFPQAFGGLDASTESAPPIHQGRAAAAVPAPPQPAPPPPQRRFPGFDQQRAGPAAPAPAGGKGLASALHPLDGAATALERRAALESIAQLFIAPESIGVPASVAVLQPFGFDLETAKFRPDALQRHKLMSRRPSVQHSSVAPTPSVPSPSPPPLLKFESVAGGKAPWPTAPALLQEAGGWTSSPVLDMVDDLGSLPDLPVAGEFGREFGHDDFPLQTPTRAPPEIGRPVPRRPSLPDGPTPAPVAVPPHLPDYGGEYVQDFGHDDDFNMQAPEIARPVPQRPLLPNGRPHLPTATAPPQRLPDHGGHRRTDSRNLAPLVKAVIGGEFGQLRDELKRLREEMRALRKETEDSKMAKDLQLQVASKLLEHAKRRAAATPEPAVQSKAERGQHHLGEGASSPELSTQKAGSGTSPELSKQDQGEDEAPWASFAADGFAAQPSGWSAPDFAGAAESAVPWPPLEPAAQAELPEQSSPADVAPQTETPEGSWGTAKEAGAAATLSPAGALGVEGQGPSPPPADEGEPDLSWAESAVSVGKSGAQAAAAPTAPPKVAVRSKAGRSYVAAPAEGPSALRAVTFERGAAKSSAANAPDLSWVPAKFALPDPLKAFKAPSSGSRARPAAPASAFSPTASRVRDASSPNLSWATPAYAKATVAGLHRQPEREELPSPWQLSKDTFTRYREIFRQRDADGDGFVEGSEAKDLLRQSGIEASDLAYIWALSDLDRDGRLSLEEFVCALHLTTRRRRGEELPPSLPRELFESSKELAPLWQEEPARGEEVATSRGPAMSSGSSKALVWEASPEEVEAYENAFRALDVFRRGSLGAEEVRDSFARTEVPSSDLQRIWHMADFDADGRLTPRGFACAMHLVWRRRQGVPVPAVLPVELVVSCERAKPSASRSQSPKSLNASRDLSVDKSQQAAASAPWVVDEGQLDRYRAIFKAFVVSEAGIMGPDDAREVLMRSGLPGEELLHIWQLADVDGDSHFTLGEFACAMHLASRWRSGLELPLDLPPELAALRLGLDAAASPGALNLAPASPSTAAPGSAAAPPPLHRSPEEIARSPWLVASAEVEDCRGIFESTSRRDPAYLAPQEALNVLARSELPVEELDRALQLADADEDGRLSLGEFASAMHLVSKRRQGLQLPGALPPELVASIATALAAGREEASGAWVIQPEQLGSYRGLFEGVPRSNPSYVGPLEARELLLRSGLPADVVSRILEMSDVDQDGQLTFNEFVCALHLVSGVRQGLDLPAVLPAELAEVALGGARLARSAAGGAAVRQPPGGFEGHMADDASGGWAASAEAQQAYAELFRRLDVRGDRRLLPEDVQETFQRSGLPPDELSHVWNLSDTDRDGALTLEEFACAIHILSCRRLGMALPAALPISLLSPPRAWA